MTKLFRGLLGLAFIASLSIAMPLAPALAQADQFPDRSVVSSCTHWTLITPADGTVLTRLPKALWVGGAGNIMMVGNDAPPSATGILWSAIPAGTLLPVRPREIKATGTTASLIIACY